MKKIVVCDNCNNEMKFLLKGTRFAHHIKLCKDKDMECELWFCPKCKNLDVSVCQE